MNHTSKEEEEDRVVVRLSVVTPNDISFPERRLVLTESRPLVRIGRSSNRPNLDIQCAINNGWFDSPVMSRHHAEIKADIPNKAVVIRDSSSMHGTYLNSVKLSSEEPLRHNDHLIFGVPVYRNERTFQPAGIRVDTVAFLPAVRPTTSPNRVFTVPDDCSTDDNEPLDEPMEDPLPSSRTGPVINDTEKDAWHPERSHARPGLIPQVDGAIDLVSDAESAHGPSSEIYEDSILLSDDDVMCSEAETSLESLDLSDSSDEWMEGPTPTYRHTSSPASAEEFTDGESDDHSSLSGNEAESVFLYETDSDMDAAELSDTTRLSEHPEEARGLSSTQSLHSQAPDLMLPRLPPLNMMFPPGEWDSIPRTESFSVVPAQIITREVNTVGAGPRAPSPSDAALPHGPRRTDVGDTCISNDSQGLSRLVEKDWAEVADERISAATMGQKSGKPAFFEAREQNKLTIARITNQASTPRPTSPVSSGDSSKPCGHDDQGLITVQAHEKTLNETKLSTSSSKISCVDKPTDSEARPSERIPTPPSLPHNDVSDGSARVSTSIDETHTEASMAYHQNPAASWAEYNPYDFEPASAYELQLLKLRKDEQQASDSPSITPNQGVPVDTLPTPKGVHCAEERITNEYFSLDEGDGVRTQKDNKGKRKAAEISELSEAELTWARRTMPEAISEVPRTPSPRPTLLQPPLPSPPTTPEEPSRVEVRPAKRMRKFAERMGYAALGGATVGAVVLTSLIYTAPTFV